MEKEKTAIKQEEFVKEIEGLEVSKDTSKNHKNAKDILIKIFENKNLTKKEKIELLDKVANKFKFPEELEKELREMCKKIYNNTDEGKEEYINNLVDEISQSDNESSYVPTITPYQDITEKHGLSYMATMVDRENKKHKCFVSSKKEIFKYEDCDLQGIFLKHKKNKSKFNVLDFFQYAKDKDNVTAYNIFVILRNILLKYIIFPFESLYDIIAIWIMHTYVYCLFRYVPYIWLNAEAGSGKSTVMDVMKEFCFNGITNVGSTPAVIFRTIDNDGSTLFLDEFENMTGDEKTLILTILKVGFKSGATVSRCAENNYEPQQFSAFSPKVFAGISNIDNVLLSRCIKINMKKVKDLSNIDEFQLTPEFKKEISSIVNKLHIFGLKYAETISEIYQKKELVIFPDSYSLREKDLWKPLYSIATIIDKEGNTNTKESIMEYSKILNIELYKAQNTELKPRLLNFLEEYIKDNTNLVEENWYCSQEILASMKETDDFPEITSKESLGKYLGDFGFQKDRKLWQDFYNTKSSKRTFYYITEEIITEIKNKNNW